MLGSPSWTLLLVVRKCRRRIIRDTWGSQWWGGGFRNSFDTAGHALRVAVECASGADEPGDGVRGFFDLVLGGLAAGFRGVDDTLLEVVVKQPECHTLERIGQGADLGEDVDAVLLLVDHAVDAAGLALDAFKPGEVAVFVGDVAVVAALAVRTLRFRDASGIAWSLRCGGHRELLSAVACVPDGLAGTTNRVVGRLAGVSRRRGRTWQGRHRSVGRSLRSTANSAAPRSRGTGRRPRR